jgi:hypothetical protein
LEGFRRGRIEITTRYLPGGTEEKHKKLNHDSRCPDKDSNQAPAEKNLKFSVLAAHDNKEFCLLP